jgi:glycosyltransferase involved in cell wall biosynthesis
MSRKVLIIAYYWPPAGGGGVQRWVKFVKYLRGFGWEPVVYTAENADYPLLDPTLEQDIPSDIEVIRRPITEPYNLFRALTGKKKSDKMDPAFLSQGKKLGWKEQIATWIRGNFFIPDARCLWIKPSVRFLLQYLKEHPVDIIVSTGPPHTCHLIGLGIKQKLGLPWIADFRDQWSQIDYFDDLKLTAIARKKHLRLEKAVLDQSDAVVTVGPYLGAELGTLTNNRIEVITNGFDEADRGAVTEISNKRFSLVYIGTINDAQNPVVLWRALSALKSENHPLMDDFVLKIVGKAEAQILKDVREFNLEDIVEHIGYVPHAEAIAWQERASVLLLLINNTKNNKAIVTGKLFEYLASGHPILCIGPDDGDASQIIRSVGAGITVDYQDSEALVLQLKEWYQAYQSGNLLLNPADILKFSRRELTKKMAKLFDELYEKGLS